MLAGVFRGSGRQAAVSGGQLQIHISQLIIMGYNLLRGMATFYKVGESVVELEPILHSILDT